MTPAAHLGSPQPSSSTRRGRSGCCHPRGHADSDSLSTSAQGRPAAPASVCAGSTCPLGAVGYQRGVGWGEPPGLAFLGSCSLSPLGTGPVLRGTATLSRHFVGKSKPPGPCSLDFSGPGLLLAPQTRNIVPAAAGQGWPSSFESSCVEMVEEQTLNERFFLVLACRLLAWLEFFLLSYFAEVNMGCGEAPTHSPDDKDGGGSAHTHLAGRPLPGTASPTGSLTVRRPLQRPPSRGGAHASACDKPLHPGSCCSETSRPHVPFLASHVPFLASCNSPGPQPPWMCPPKATAHVAWTAVTPSKLLCWHFR